MTNANQKFESHEFDEMAEAVSSPAHSPVTNLMVQTVDATRQNRLYTFDVFHSSNPRYVGVQILPAIARSQPSPVVNNLNITPDGIQTGLSIAIMRGYTSIDDPVVAQVRRLLQLTQTENMTVAEAAYSVGIPFTVIEELGRLSREGQPTLSIQDI
ncbi:MAG: hypothetical protein HC865_22655 [Cyanobacteria bacterium RU_5_0]|nr:hypothetical protein [Cyanobacteria bacterium RU_5_0]